MNMFKFWGGSQEQGGDARPQETTTTTTTTSSSYPPSSNPIRSDTEAAEAASNGIILYFKDKRRHYPSVLSEVKVRVVIIVILQNAKSLEILWSNDVESEYEERLRECRNQKLGNMVINNEGSSDASDNRAVCFVQGIGFFASCTRCVDELQKLLSDKEAYQQFLLSIDPVRTQNNVRDELRNETLQLARQNLEKEPQITELRNQCKIIRTSELESAQEKLNVLTKRKAEILKSYSPASLLHKLQEAMNKTDEDSEMLQEQLLGKEIDLATFVQQYKKLRVSYHKQALTHLAASTSLVG